jgi:PAS domain S-box-containing protein
MTANYFTRVAILAALYMITGWLGLLLAVPPGYATIIWPPSGIALGMLIVGGARLWPGVFIGSLLLNAYNSGVFADADWLSTRSLAAACIAAGSTLQALIGRALIARFIGLPLRLNTLRDIFALLALGGPLTCVVAASIGVAALATLGIVPRAAVAQNWLSWWSGDLLGVLVFMPLVLLAPGSREQLKWRDASVGQLPLAALLLLLLPLGLTFYLWKASTGSDQRHGAAKFETLTTESEKALQNRLSSYGGALLGAAGFIQGSMAVSRDEWRTYVEAIDVRSNFPGINGLGWIQPVEPGGLEAFLAEVRADGAPDFEPHRVAAKGPNYLVRYIEPLGDNRLALGLNIAFEDDRLAAANLARDSARAAISGPVVLVQDERRSLGLVLFYPVYQHDMPQTTVEQRRAALRGWTYAPVIARNFLADLTHGQSSDYRLRIYDGDTARPDALLYSSDARPSARPGFKRRTTLSIMQRRWLLVWESTPAFERAERSANPLLILIGGLVFTALLTLLLIVLAARRTEQVEQMIGQRRFVVPALVFAVLSAGSFALFWQLREREADFVERRLQDETSKIESLLRARVAERVGSLGRLAARWDAADDLDEREWRYDAANHVSQLSGLRALEWVDAGYRVRWVEPLAGNEKALGLDVRADPRRAAALRGAADRAGATITPPLHLVQGYAGFIAYLPVRRGRQADGFMAGVFSIEDFFHGAISDELSRNYTMAILHEGTVYFTNTRESARLSSPWVSERVMRIGDEAWTLRVAPTPAFVAAQKSSLPSLVLVAGLLVAALAALSVRFMLISRVKSLHLGKSLALNAGIISSSAHLVIAIDSAYRIMIFNRAAEQALGYKASEVIGRRAIPIFMDPSELEARARSLSDELGETIEVGPDIFTRIPLRDGFEKREWTFIRKNGTRFPVNVIITPLRDQDGAVGGFLGVIEDITLAQEMERMKSEFTAVVSHELRTPLTSIRGSLGLILGALSTNLSPKVRDLLEIAQSNCERLVLLVNDILDMEKFSAGQMRFDMRATPLAHVVTQAVEANEGYARRLHARIDLVPVPEEWIVEVDPERFIQVMSNLLSNAAKYSPPGGTVRVWTEQRGDALRINVRDDGPGIPGEFRARIFEKFSQADASTTREKGGTGLGLHIARRFIEHMHGRIGFESEVGAGSTFWVELPGVQGIVAASGGMPATAGV